MKFVKSTVTLVALAALLSACGSPRQRGPSNAVINRVLTGAPGAAQPSSIVAAEIEYVQATKADGQFTAAQRFAAPGAQFHTRNGPVSAALLFGSLTDPDVPNEWSPRTVVMSCDGALALSMGRFRDNEGFVGNYVTAWVRQNDNSYKWIYDVAGRDDPQPPPRPEFEDGDIVVTAIDSIEGLVASCPRAGEEIPPPPALSITDTPGDATLSRDGTLRWRWEHRADGTKYVAAEYFYEGVWLTAIEESLTSPANR